MPGNGPDREGPLPRPVEQHPDGKVRRDVLEPVRHTCGAKQQIPWTYSGYFVLDPVPTGASGNEIQLIALVRNLHREPTKRKLVRTITALCKELGITVLAEGIESREERDTLEGLGCDLQQGFLFARPGRAFPSVHW